MNQILITKPKSSRTQSTKKEELGENMLNVNQVAKMLDLSVSHVYFLTSKKAIPHIKLSNKKVLFDKKDIENWLDKKRVEPIK
jgi:excisionase family DNA binding protein